MYRNDREFPLELDREDPIAKYRENFYIPSHNGREAVYLCGNSLGLQPKKTEEYIGEELQDWKT